MTTKKSNDKSAFATIKTRKTFMTQKYFCGIDFGTSNSSIAVATRAQKPQMVAVENEHITIPSAIFYPSNRAEPSFGRKAMQ